MNHSINQETGTKGNRETRTKYVDKISKIDDSGYAPEGVTVKHNWRESNPCLV